MHINIEDAIVGGALVISSVILLQHFRKQPDAPRTRTGRILSIVMMILGWMIVVWDPVWALAFGRP